VKKNIPSVIDRSLKNEQILIIFGKNSYDTSGY